MARWQGVRRLVIPGMVALFAAGMVAVLLLGVLRTPSGPRVALEPTDAQGTVLALPPPGSVVAEYLSDETPVFVVHADDGDVTVVDARDPHDVGLQILVGWCATSGWFEEGPFGSRFLPDGRWLAGPAPSDLATFQSEVDGGQLRVGARRDATGRSGGDLPGLPGPTCEPTPPGIEDARHREGMLVMHHGEEDPLAVDEAARQPLGSVVLVAGHLERVGMTDPVLCAPAGQLPYCARRGVAAGVDSPAFVDDADYASGFAGRFLVRVTDHGFRDVTVLADASSYARAFQGEWELIGPLAVADDRTVEGVVMHGEAEPWLLVHDDLEGHGEWTGFGAAHNLQVIGRQALAGSDEPTPLAPSDLRLAVEDGRAASTAFRVTLNKADGLASRIEELP